MSTDAEEKQGQLTVSVEEAARLLGCSRGLMFRMVREKRIHALRLGRRILISKKVLESMLSGDWQQPTA